MRPRARAAERWLSGTASMPERIDLGRVGRVREDERGDAPEHGAVGSPADLQGGHAEAEQQDQQDERDAAQHVDEDDGQQRGWGRRPGPGSCGSRPAAGRGPGWRPGPRRRTSACRARSPAARRARPSRKSSRLKNWCRTSGQLGLLTTSADDQRRGTTTVLMVAISAPRAPSSRNSARATRRPRSAAEQPGADPPTTVEGRSGLRVRHRAVTSSRVGMSPPWLSHSSSRSASVPSSLAWPAPRSRRGSAGCRPRRASRAPRRRPACGQHADDRRVRDLDRGDVVGGRAGRRRCRRPGRRRRRPWPRRCRRRPAASVSGWMTFSM